MKYVFYGLIGLVCLLIAAVVFLFVAAPTGFVRDQAVAFVKERTGRDLRIAGGASFTVYPAIGVTLSDVTLSGPPGLEGETFAEMKSVVAAVRLWPLLQRRIEIEQFLLEQPVVTLAIDAEGRKTWDFRAPAAAGESDTGLRGSSTDAGGGSVSGGIVARTAALAGVRLGTFRITDGTLRFRDARKGVAEEVTAIDLELALADIAAPFEAKGRATWKGQVLPFAARLGSLQQVLEGQPTELKLDLDGELATARFAGQLTAADSVKLAGALDLSSPSLRNLIAWSGGKPPDIGGLGAFSLKGDASIDGGTTTLKSVVLALDGANGKGDLTLTTGAGKPSLGGDLALDKLDLNTYLGATKVATNGTAKATGGSTTAASTGTKAATTGWSTTPIDARGLDAADAEVHLVVGSLLFRDLEVGKSDVYVVLEDGQLKTRFASIALYDGKGVGNVAVVGGKKPLRLDANFTFTGVSALPLLKDLNDFDWVAGRGDLSFGFTTTGKSQRDMIGALTGQGRFLFKDGAIVGINFPQMVRGFTQGKISSWKREPTQTTDFSELSASFTVANGIASNSDLKLVGPLLRAGGSGKIMLPARTLDYRVEPKIVASLQGQGAAADAKGLTIPFELKGPWSKPEIKPDLAALVKNPETVGKVKDLVNDLTKGKTGTSDKLKGLLEGVLGGTQQ